MASVVGREFRLEVLEALLDEPVERIIAALEEAATAGLVREVADDADRFVFAHALVRETLYERQSATRRVRLHHRIALALEELGRSADARRARPPLLREPPPGPRGQGGRLLRAGRGAAADALAYEEAAAHYAAALERLARRRARGAARCCSALGAAEARARRPATRRRRSRAPRRSPAREGLPELLARGRARAARGYAQAARSTARRSSCSSARSAALDDEGPLRRAAAGAARERACTSRARRERVEELSARALELARRSDDPLALRRPRWRAATPRSCSIARPRRAARGSRASSRRSPSASASPSCRCSALHWRTYDLLEAGDVDGARARPSRARAARRRAAPADLPLLRARWEVMWAMIADRARRDRQALIDARARARHAARRRPRSTSRPPASSSALAYRHRHARQLRADARGRRSRATRSSCVNLPGARARPPAGRRPRGRRRDLRAARRRRLRRDPARHALDERDRVLAQVCALLGDRTRAAILYDLLLPTATAT